MQIHMIGIYVILTFIVAKNIGNIMGWVSW